MVKKDKGEKAGASANSHLLAGTGPWTRFMDMHSGGGTKEEPYQYIYIQALMEEAKVIFYNRFGHNPERVTCTCCGDDYSISESKTFAEATAYERNCEWDGEAKAYIEEQEKSKMNIRASCNTSLDDGWGLYQTVEDYLKRKDILVITESEIRKGERVGTIPEQGYVWVD